MHFLDYIPILLQIMTIITNINRFTVIFTPIIINNNENSRIIAVYALFEWLLLTIIHSQCISNIAHLSNMKTKPNASLSLSLRRNVSIIESNP